MAQLSVWARLCTMFTLLCKLPALPNLGMRLGATNFTCKTTKQAIHVSEEFHRTQQRRLLKKKKCRDAGEPCGAIRDVKVERCVEWFGDGAIEPPWSHRIAELRLLEWIGSVENSERCFHQGFFVGPHLQTLVAELDSQRLAWQFSFTQKIFYLTEWANTSEIANLFKNTFEI